MSQFRTILHPTDFSTRSRHAFEAACALARDQGARLIVLHVIRAPALTHGVPADIREHDAYRRFNRIVLERIEAPGGRPSVEHRMEEGDPAEVILAVAKRYECDLIVMGTHGRTGFNRMLMGSVAEQVTRRAECPVMTVKAPPEEAGVPTAPPAAAEVPLVP